MKKNSVLKAQPSALWWGHAMKNLIYLLLIIAMIVLGGLVQAQTLAGLLLHQQESAVPLHHGGDGHIGLPLSIEGGHGAQFYREPSHRPRIARHLALPVRAGGKLCAKIALS